MKLIEFKDYEAYVRAQRRTDRRKSRRPCVRREDVRKIAKWIRKHGISVNRGICHGARYGHEVDWFSEEFPVANIIGTDLFDKGHPKIVQADFHEDREEWRDAFDFVYSNSLDHSYDPVKCLGVWLGQVKDNGILLLQWSKWAIGVKGGDCFGAHFHEYLEMLDRVASVADVIYHYGTVVTIAVRRGGGEQVLLHPTGPLSLA